MHQQIVENREQKNDILRMTADVVSAYVGNNTLPATQLNDIIQIVYGSLQKLDGSQTNSVRSKAAIAIRKSITPDYIVCLEDGKKLKMLKRHLRTVYGMTPEEYRAKWGLPADYPMVAPNYSRQRSAFAKKIGLGRTAGAAA
ncbi:MAG: transcriptional regulator [Rhodospirillaceae bacterium]|nr:transcriptional regulator [Rhodospirillaceae bacterium]HAA93776.1 transcriptional regulator [Rhodospirillaceae bacterium]|tara:strand:+ start:467 stop:892 length:426 start_codon:yes stop_codon:yes gene_type:complete